MKATQLLKQQHRKVKQLFQQLQKTEGADERRDLMEQISTNLETHMRIEEEIFYPAVREESGAKKMEEMIPEAYEEHHVVKLVLAEIPQVDPEDERFEAKMTVLEELIDHHVEEEEKEMFKAAEKLGAERLNELGEEMAAEAGEPDDEDEDIEAHDAPSRGTHQRR